MFDWSFNYVAYSHNDFDESSIRNLLAHINSGLGRNGVINIAFNNREILRKRNIDFSFEKIFGKKDFSVLIRDNTRREFGAYKDLSQLNSVKGFHSNALHIFVNSTWDKHRDASDQKVIEIINSLKSATKYEEALFIGPWSTFGKPFTMNGVLISAWVCTYMFAYNQLAIAEGGLELTPENILDSYFGAMTTEETYFSNTLHPLLKKRWEAWFFGLHENLPRWYGAKKLIEFDRDFLKNKVISCIDEHYLTRTAIARHFVTPPMLSKFTGT